MAGAAGDFTSTSAVGAFYLAVSVTRLTGFHVMGAVHLEGFTIMDELLRGKEVI